MAESLPPPAKKGRMGRAAPVAKVIAKERVKQFLTELYEDDSVLFCCFCDHSRFNFMRLDTIKDLFKSKKHYLRKDEKEAAGSSRVCPVLHTLTSMVKSKDLRE